MASKNQTKFRLRRAYRTGIFSLWKLWPIVETYTIVDTKLTAQDTIRRWTSRSVPEQCGKIVKKASKLPTFLIAGAPRSGTTYLYDLLDSHPGVFLAKPQSPEPKFFLVDEEFHKGIEYYRERYFADAADFTAVGEKSTNYLEGDGVPGRIQQMLPEVRLVFVLRNPVDRAYSNYRWSVQNGLELFSFADAIEQEPVRERAYDDRMKYSRPFSYISRGRYAELLKPFFERFESSKIKVLLLDEIERAPQAAAAELFEFLQLPKVPVSFEFTERINAATTGDRKAPAEVARRLDAIYCGPNADLGVLLQRDLCGWSLPTRLF